MKVTKKVNLVPLQTATSSTGKVYFEQIVVYSEGYPSFMFHVDMFWDSTKKDNEIHDLLLKGKEVSCFMTFGRVEMEQ